MSDEQRRQRVRRRRCVDGRVRVGGAVVGAGRGAGVGRPGGGIDRSRWSTGRWAGSGWLRGGPGRGWADGRSDGREPVIGRRESIGRGRVGRSGRRGCRHRATVAPAGVDAAAGGPDRKPTARSRWSSASADHRGVAGAARVHPGGAVARQLRRPELAATRQEDLVRILSDLEAQEERLQPGHRRAGGRASGSSPPVRRVGRRRWTRRPGGPTSSGILAGTLPARGPGLTVRSSTRVEADRGVRDPQRGAGAAGRRRRGDADRRRGGAAVRIVASHLLRRRRGRRASWSTGAS